MWFKKRKDNHEPIHVAAKVQTPQPQQLPHSMLELQEESTDDIFERFCAGLRSKFNSTMLSKGYACCARKRIPIDTLEIQKLVRKVILDPCAIEYAVGVPKSDPRYYCDLCHGLFWTIFDLGIASSYLYYDKHIISDLYEVLSSSIASVNDEIIDGDEYFAFMLSDYHNASWDDDKRWKIIEDIRPVVKILLEEFKSAFVENSIGPLDSSLSLMNDVFAEAFKLGFVFGEYLLPKYK